MDTTNNLDNCIAWELFSAFCFYRYELLGESLPIAIYHDHDPASRLTIQILDASEVPLFSHHFGPARGLSNDLNVLMPHDADFF